MALPLQWIGTFDFDALQFKDEGEMFYFPRDDSCDVSVLAQAGVCCVCVASEACSALLAAIAQRVATIATSAGVLLACSMALHVHAAHALAALC